MNKKKMEIRCWLNQNMFWSWVAHYHYLLTCCIIQKEEKKVIHLLFPLWWLYKYWNILTYWSVFEADITMNSCLYSASSFRDFICFEIWCFHSGGAEESSFLECETVHIHALCFILCLRLLTQTSRIEIYVLSCILAQTFVLSNSGICLPCP
jgi:hypothetical protein